MGGAAAPPYQQCWGCAAYLFSGGVRRAATNPPAFSGRNVLPGSMQPRTARAAERGTNSSQREEFHHAKHILRRAAGTAQLKNGRSGSSALPTMLGLRRVSV